MRVRYQRLRLSGEKGNRLKLDLLAEGFLEAETIPNRSDPEGRAAAQQAGPRGDGVEWMRWFGPRVHRA